MAQSPFLVDVIQIEPGSGQTLTVSRSSSDGSLKFVDTLIPSGISLTSLSGLRNITGVYVVGRGGSGAPYTTIQGAIDAIPVSSSPLLPSLVLVMPGVYTENVSIQRDGVSLVGLGGVVLQNDGSSDTVVISASLEAVPTKVLLKNLTIKNNQASKCCVNILGADSFASGELNVLDAPLATGDTVTIGGEVLTGVAGTRTSGSNNFSVSGGTVSAVAAEIAAAINDTENGFSATVSATSVLGVVNIESVVAGSVGNSIGLACNTTPGGNLTVSGAFLTGGSSADSVVGSEQILIEDCILVASGVGGLQLSADTVNKVFVRGGSFYGSSSTSQCQVVNTALFSMEYVSWVNDVALSYDTSEDRPDDTSCSYGISYSPRVKDVTCSLSGEGVLKIRDCSEVGTFTAGGDQSCLGLNSNMLGLTLSGTVSVSLGNCTRTTALLSGGSPTLAETISIGTLEFDNSGSETYSFDVPAPDANYQVSLESPVTSEVIGVSAKDENGFTVEFSGPVTGTVNWVVHRKVGVS